MIPVFKPLIEKEEIEASTQSLEMGWLGMGSYVSEFENAIQAFTQSESRFVAALSTGHAALHVGLIIAGVKPGDEVITPSFNNIADLQAILAVGARPVFCDIEEGSLCIDLNQAEKLISNKTKAIIVMDYDCHLCDHDHVKELSDKYNIRVIHDAAHSFGSKYKGKMIGSFSDITMFSFDPVKTITSIDGGALIVKTDEELKKIHQLRLIGMGQPAKMMYQNKRAWTYDVTDIGYRYHMANLHGAIGLAQIKKMDRIAKSRRETGILYNKELSTISGIVIPKTNFLDVVPFLYYIRVLDGRRQELIDFLNTNGVDSGIHWQPGHKFSLFKDEKKGDLTITEKISTEILSLPFHSCMTTADMVKVTETVKLFFKKK